MNHGDTSPQSRHGIRCRRRTGPRMCRRGVDSSFPARLSRFHNLVADMCSLGVRRPRGRRLRCLVERWCRLGWRCRRFRGRRRWDRALGPVEWVRIVSLRAPLLDLWERKVRGVERENRADPSAAQTVQVRSADTTVGHLNVHICLFPGLWIKRLVGQG